MEESEGGVTELGKQHGSTAQHRMALNTTQRYPGLTRQPGSYPRRSVARRNGSGCVSCPVQLLPPAAAFLAARLRVTRPPSWPCAPNTKMPAAPALPLAAALEWAPPLCSTARWSVLSAKGSGTVGALVSTCGTPSWPLRSCRMRLLQSTGGGATQGGGVTCADRVDGHHCGFRHNASRRPHPRSLAGLAGTGIMPTTACPAPAAASKLT